MSILADVERFLYLHPNPATSDIDPLDLLRELYVTAKNHISGVQQTTMTQLRTRVVELEGKYKEAREKFHAEERRALALEAQLASNALYQKIQALEAEVAKYRGLVRSTEHEAVRLSEKLKGKQSSKPR